MLFGGRQCGHSVLRGQRHSAGSNDPPAGAYLRGPFAASGADLFGKEELVFHVSGGTTDLLHCKGPDSITCIGTSSDLYAGQAVDRLGVRLGYAFPAGIYVSQLAATCTENIKPKVSVRGTTCSLSGLQNQCEKLLAEGKKPGICQ